MTTVKPELTLALPTYNEMANIEKTIEDSARALETTGRPWEILVIDNHSDDETPEIVGRRVESDPRMRLIVHDQNRLWSGSLRTALKESRGKYVAFMDSDGQFTARDLPRFIAKLEGRANVVYGWRKNRQDPFGRKFVSFVFNTMAKLLLKFDMHDLNTGIQMFDRKFMEIAKITYPINLANPELYVRARRAGLVIEEVEVDHYPRVEGESSHNFVKVIKICLDNFRYFSTLRREHQVGRR